MNIAIIGCGLIGKKRAEALRTCKEDTLILVCDIDKNKADVLAKEFQCESTTDWRDVVGRNDVDVIINSSINSILKDITIASLERKKHVLCEKPLGRNVVEAEQMIHAAEQSGKLLKTGFNHRFHPGIWQAKEMTDAGKIGKLLTIRARYGHGSRPGMEKEWRSSKELCGGGELLDQGVHIIDLMRWFGGEVIEVFGKVETKFWNIKVEDNAFVILKTKNDVHGIFHVSWTNWKNIFSFEVTGTDGYLKVEGLGGSYGTERLEWGIRNSKGGQPKIEEFEFDFHDVSWEREWLEFRNSIIEKRQPLSNGVAGWRANQVVEAIYSSSERNTVVYLPDMKDK